MFDGSGRVSPYERIVRVDNLAPGEFRDDKIIYVKQWLERSYTPTFEPTGFILGYDSEDADRGWTWFDHSARGDDRHARVPMACFVVHPGSINQIFLHETTASQIFIVGINR